MRSLLKRLSQKIFDATLIRKPGVARADAVSAVEGRGKSRGNCRSSSGKRRDLTDSRKLRDRETFSAQLMDAVQEVVASSHHRDTCKCV